jgi:hypothetical protein
MQRTQTLLFSSSVDAGASNVTADGTTFEANFNSPLLIPVSARYCEAALTTASIWNTSPNVSASFGNNKFEVTYLASDYTITIADGLYSLTALNDYINRALQNLGIPYGQFTFAADTASQRTVLTIQNIGSYVDFGAASSVGVIMGWPIVSGIVAATSLGQHFYSPVEAAFNRNNYYLVETDMVQNGLPVNALARGILGAVPINVAPGSQITYDPSTPLWFDASELIGRPRMGLRFRLLNQDLLSAPTAGDTYSFTVQLRWGQA